MERVNLFRDGLKTRVTRKGRGISRVMAGVCVVGRL